MAERTLFYWSKLYTEQLKPGQNFRELMQTITINILDFDLLKIKNYHSIFHLWEDHQKDYLLTDVLEIHFIELPKFRRINQDVKNPLHRWLLFMEDISPDLLEVLKMEDPAIARAESVLDWLSCDQETLRLYELREKAIHDEITRIEGAFDKGKEEGKQEGRQEGKQEGQIEMILQLLTVKFGGIPAELEINLHGLAPEKLKELVNAVLKVNSLKEFENILDN